jgi:hypothetical protein
VYWAWFNCYLFEIAEKIWNGVTTCAKTFTGVYSFLDPAYNLWHVQCQPKFVVEWWVIIAPCSHSMLQVNFVWISYYLIRVKWVYPLHIMGSLLGSDIKDLDHITLFRCTSGNFNQWYNLYYLILWEFSKTKLCWNFVNESKKSMASKQYTKYVD